MNIYEIKKELLSGKMQLAEQYAGELKQLSAEILGEDIPDQNILGTLIDIYRIIYEDSSREDILIDDGIYDMMVAKYQSMGNPIPIGAPLVDIENTKNNTEQDSNDELICPVKFFDMSERRDKLEFFRKELLPLPSDIALYNNYFFLPQDLYSAPVIFNSSVTKRTHSTPHEHPSLVGTLDKCKFVFVEDAKRVGVDIEDPKVKILERDFFAKHIMDGIISPDEEFEVILELKYDGTSIEANCSNVVESARSRGDTGIGMASDMTDLIKGYPFPRSPFITEEKGIKFEVIMQYNDLYMYNIAREASYKNCRTAINGFFNSSDASRYRDYITMVPLDMDPNDIPQEVLDEFPGRTRLASAAFLNAYYVTKGVPFICTTVQGNYRTVLFMIKKFLEEADYARQFMPFMYDGIVVEYTSDEIRERLGRENYVNKFAMAVKFDPLKKQTIARDYKYTVGKDGSITPMIYYDPVEFYGTIHPKSSAQSYAHFIELGIKPGDIIDVTYTNDVMPYVTRPSNTHNDNNPNPPFEFTKVCPVCGAPVILSKTGKSAYCSNKLCDGIKVAKAVDMLSKLGFEGFAEKSVKDIGLYTFHELMECPPEMLNLGEADTQSFVDQRYNLLYCRQIADNEFLGALGFTGISTEKWGYVCQTYSPQDIINICESQSVSSLTKIRGIGPLTAETIINEYPYFKDDILYGFEHLNIMPSVGTGKKLSIRYSGVRNKQLMEQLISMGYDAKDGSVTKTTDILLVPNEGYVSSKTQKAGPNTKIVPIDHFVSNMDAFLN